MTNLKPSCPGDDLRLILESVNRAMLEVRNLTTREVSNYLFFRITLFW